jgi:hypothetical protein
VVVEIAFATVDRLLSHDPHLKVGAFDSCVYKKHLVAILREI